MRSRPLQVSPSPPPGSIAGEAGAVETKQSDAKNNVPTPSPAQTPPTGKTTDNGSAQLETDKLEDSGANAANNGDPRAEEEPKDGSTPAQGSTSKKGKKKKKKSKKSKSTASGNDPNSTTVQAATKQDQHQRLQHPPTSLLLNPIILRNLNRRQRQRDPVARSLSKYSTARTPKSFAISPSRMTCAPPP